MDERVFEYNMIRKEMDNIIKFTSWKGLGEGGGKLYGKLNSLLEESDNRLFDNSDGKYGKRSTYQKPE